MEELFLSVLNMSFAAGYVILFVMLVRLPLKKAPKVISYVLWGVVAFRLLCPFSFESGFSLLPVSTTPIPQDIIYQASPQVNSGFAAVDTLVNGALPSAPVEASVNPLQIYIKIGAYIWILGFAVMLIYSIASVLILKRRLGDAHRAGPNIYEAHNLRTPFVLGFFRPRIYIPAGLAAREKEYILRHEETHISRFDHIVKPVAFLVLCLHWFNPLVWIAFWLMSMDIELSCDEKVIRDMGGEMKKAYSASLLSLASGRHIINGSPLAFGEGNVKSRIENVLNYKKPAFWMVAAAIAVVAVLVLGLISNPRQDKFFSQTDEVLSFTTGETGIIQIGEIAFDKYMSLQTSEKTPVSERIASYKLNDISVLAGDINEFCVSLNFDFTTDNDSFVSPARGAQGKGTWPDNYLEIRVQKTGENSFVIMSIGTGGGGQGLKPYAAPETTLEPVAPSWTPEQSVGADMAVLDYASNDFVIFHGYFGLFVYDLKSLQIIRSLDLKPLNCDKTQGDDYCEVSVSVDGNTVQLHPISSNNMYVYTVSSHTLQETDYKPMKNPFGSQFVPIAEAINSETGNYSYNAVRFDTNEYGLLHTYDWTLGTLSYGRGDMIYRLLQ